MAVCNSPLQQGGILHGFDSSDQMQFLAPHLHKRNYTAFVVMPTGDELSGVFDASAIGTLRSGGNHEHC